MTRRTAEMATTAPTIPPIIGTNDVRDRSEDGELGLLGDMGTAVGVGAKLVMAIGGDGTVDNKVDEAEAVDGTADVEGDDMTARMVWEDDNELNEDEPDVVGTGEVEVAATNTRLPEVVGGTMSDATDDCDDEKDWDATEDDWDNTEEHCCDCDVLSTVAGPGFVSVMPTELLLPLVDDATLPPPVALPPSLEKQSPVGSELLGLSLPLPSLLGSPPFSLSMVCPLPW
jgi:hypothetical protein